MAVHLKGPAQMAVVDGNLWQPISPTRSSARASAFLAPFIGGVAGAGFVILASTITATRLIPVEGLALLLGIDRFLSGAPAIGNVIGNAVASVVIARLSSEFDEHQATQQYREYFNDPTINHL